MSHLDGTRLAAQLRSQGHLSTCDMDVFVISAFCFTSFCLMALKIARSGSDFGLNTVTKPKQTLPDRCHDGAAASNVFL